MNNISAWAIRHPITPIVLFVVLFFLGVVAFVRLPINLSPDISFPLVKVVITQPGAAPSEMEPQIAEKVEGSIASIGNVHNIVTFIIEGTVEIDVEFQIGTPIDRAVTDVRDAVAKVRNDLPQGIQEPLVERINIDSDAIAYYAVTTTTLTPEQLSWTIDNSVTKRLLSIPGVAQVSRSGGVSREIRVELDPGRLQALGLSSPKSTNRCARSISTRPAGGPRWAAANRPSASLAAPRRRRLWGIRRSSRGAAVFFACARSRTYVTTSRKCAASPD